MRSEDTCIHYTYTQDKKETTFDKVWNLILNWVIEPSGAIFALLMNPTDIPSPVVVINMKLITDCISIVLYDFQILTGYKHAPVA